MSPWIEGRVSVGADALGHSGLTWPVTSSKQWVLAVMASAFLFALWAIVRKTVLVWPHAKVTLPTSNLLEVQGERRARRFLTCGRSDSILQWMALFISFFSSPLNCLTTIQYTDFERWIEFFKTLRLCRSSESSCSMYRYLFTFS